MINTIKSLIIKYKELITYGIFGVATTVVNFVTFKLASMVLGEELYLLSNVIAWVTCVIFAYITNKLWVFESKRTGSKIIKECIIFFSCRMLTGIFDLLIMYYAVDVFEFDAYLWKLISNIAVIVLNYLAGIKK